MNATKTPALGGKPKLSGIERAFAFLDLAIAAAILAYWLFGLVAAFRPSAPARDNAVFGWLWLALLLPFGIAALAAFDAIRSRAAGRWLLQALALIPAIVIGSAVVWAGLVAHAG